MAELEIPTVRPGLVGLKNKKSGKVEYFFPVDVQEVAAANPGVYDYANDGSIEAARLAMTPLRQSLVADPKITAVEVAGIEGQVVTGKDEAEAKAIVEQSTKSSAKEDSAPAKNETKSDDSKSSSAAKK